MKKCILLLICIISLSNVFAQETFEIPKKPYSEYYVYDFTNTLKLDEIVDLNNKIVSFKQASSIEIAIVLVEDLKGKDAFDAAFQIGRKWGVGKKELDNGLVYLISLKDRKHALSVGYDLEGDIPDIKAKHLIDLAAPEFKQQHYYQGITIVLNNILNELKPISWEQRQSYLKEKLDAEKDKDKQLTTIATWILLIVVLFVLFVVYKRKKKDPLIDTWKDEALSAQEIAQKKEIERKQHLTRLKLLLDTAIPVCTNYLTKLKESKDSLDNYNLGYFKYKEHMNDFLKDLKNRVTYVKANLKEESLKETILEWHNQIVSDIGKIENSYNSAKEQVSKRIKEELFVKKFITEVNKKRALAEKNLKNTPYKTLNDNLYDSLMNIDMKRAFLYYSTAKALSDWYDKIISYEETKKPVETKRKVSSSDDEEKRSETFVYPTINETHSIPNTSQDSDFGGGSFGGGGAQSDW